MNNLQKADTTRKTDMERELAIELAILGKLIGKQQTLGPTSKKMVHKIGIIQGD